MSRRKKNITVLEDVELKPQVIGTIYKKQTNIFRTLVIIAIFGFCVYYINDISVIINNYLGRNTAESIKDSTENDYNQNNNIDSNQNEEKEIVYNDFSTINNIELEDLILKDFTYNNRKLSFRASNETESTINYSDKNYFIELYNQQKTLMSRLKFDINSISAGNKMNYTFENVNEFNYIAFIEKSVDDYPAVTLKEDDNGNTRIVCKKDMETIVYTFVNDSLKKIKHTITLSDKTNDNYDLYYNNYKDKVDNYNTLSGYIASFSDTDNGFIASIEVDLEKATADKIKEKYYYKYQEMPKVVKFEMETYGFTCS